MRPAIASGANTRDMFINTMKAYPDLLALLTNGANGLLPQGNLDPLKVAKPFIYVRREGDGSQGSDDMGLGTWVLEVHERIGYGLVKVDKIITLIDFLFRHQTWPRPTDSLERPRRSYWAGATGELPDDGWKTIKRIARIQLVQS